MIENNDANFNSLEDDLPDEGNMTLLDHLRELRKRLIICFVCFFCLFGVCWLFAADILNILMLPLARIMEEVGGSNRMIFTGLTEGFFTYLKVSAFGAFLFSFPIFVWQLWRFLAPGLYKKEKKAVMPLLLSSPALFWVGAGMVYFIIIPLAWRFLLGFQTVAGETALPIELEARVSEYLSLVMTLIIAFGVCFQLPVLLVLFVFAGVISSASLKNARRYAVVAIFVIAAIVTPPDVISQIGLAIPLLLLYELTIVAAKKIEARKID